MAQIGKILILFGSALVFIGLIFLLTQRIAGERSLPGTLRIELGNATIFFPILASIIASIILTILLNLISQLFSH